MNEPCRLKALSPPSKLNNNRFLQTTLHCQFPLINALSSLAHQLTTKHAGNVMTVRIPS